MPKILVRKLGKPYKQSVGHEGYQTYPQQTWTDWPNCLGMIGKLLMYSAIANTTKTRSLKIVTTKLRLPFSKAFMDFMGSQLGWLREVTKVNVWYISKWHAGALACLFPQNQNNLEKGRGTYRPHSNRFWRCFRMQSLHWTRGCQRLTDCMNNLRYFIYQCCIEVWTATNDFICEFEQHWSSPEYFWEVT